MYNLAKSEIVDGQEVSLLPAKEEITLGKDLQEVTYYYTKQAKVIVESTPPLRKSRTFLSPASFLIFSRISS